MAAVWGSESCTGGRLPPRPGWILAEDVRLVMSNMVSLDTVSTTVTHHGATTKHGAPSAFSCPSLPPAPAGGHSIAGRGPGHHQHWRHLHPHLPAGHLLRVLQLQVTGDRELDCIIIIIELLFRSPSGHQCDFEWIRRTWNVTTTSCHGLHYRAAFAGQEHGG